MFSLLDIFDRRPPPAQLQARCELPPKLGGALAAHYAHYGTLRKVIYLRQVKFAGSVGNYIKIKGSEATPGGAAGASCPEAGPSLRYSLRTRCTAL